MRAIPDWKAHFTKRFKSSDGHLLFTEDTSPYLGVQQSLVGFLAEVSPAQSLERIEALLEGTVIVIEDPIQIPGRPASGPREVPTDPVAVRETVDRTNEWLRCVKKGLPAGEGPRVVSDGAGELHRAASLLSGGLLLIAAPEIVDGLLLALQPRLFQSQKIKDLHFVTMAAMRSAVTLSPLFNANRWR